jgi:hypothetical protein
MRARGIGIWGESTARWFMILLMALVTSACSPPKQVYIPYEWQAPPPPSSASSLPAPPQPQSAPQHLPQGPILKPPPSFTEQDLSSGSSTGPPPAKKQEAQSPQLLASMHLVDQAKASIAQGKVDHAITLLEKSIQVDGYNGEAFFQLAKAWRMKGSRQKSVEFFQKAEILYQDNPAKLKELYRFAAELYKDSGDAVKSDQYRQKAARL